MQTKINAALFAAVTFFAVPASAQVLQEDFNNVAGLSKAGWVFQNNSSPAPAVNSDWTQGDSSVFHDRTGIDNSYISASYQSVGDPGGTISNWLLTPAVPLANGDTIRFYTRTVDALSFPDRLEVRLSLSGGSSNVGTTPGSVGDFSDLLLTVNPALQNGPQNYPTTFTPYNITLSGLPSGASVGRLGFRYFVTDAGTFGNNGNYIGVDSLSISAVPEPSALAFLACGLSAGWLRSRRRR